jgi:hypothetical protein
MTTTIRTFTPEFRPGIRTPQQQPRNRRAVYRERETGVGYGNSSGYATERRYVRDWAGQALFRCG